MNFCVLNGISSPQTGFWAITIFQLTMAGLWSIYFYFQRLLVPFILTTSLPLDRGDGQECGHLCTLLPVWWSWQKPVFSPGCHAKSPWWHSQPCPLLSKSGAKGNHPKYKVQSYLNQDTGKESYGEAGGSAPLMGTWSQCPQAQGPETK